MTWQLSASLHHKQVYRRVPSAYHKSHKTHLWTIWNVTFLMHVYKTFAVKSAAFVSFLSPKEAQCTVLSLSTSGQLRPLGRVSIKFRKKPSLSKVPCLPSIRKRFCQVLVFIIKRNSVSRVFLSLCNGRAIKSPGRRHELRVQKIDSLCKVCQFYSRENKENKILSYTQEHCLLLEVPQYENLILKSVPFFGPLFSWALEYMFGAHLCAYVPITSLNTLLSYNLKNHYDTSFLERLLTHHQWQTAIQQILDYLKRWNNL